MPILFGLLAALGIGAYAVKARADDRTDVPLLKAPVPFAGLLYLGLVAVLNARQRTIEGEGPPKSFRVQLVGVPDAGIAAYTGVLLENVPPMRKGDMIQFSRDKVVNVLPPSAAQ